MVEAMRRIAMNFEFVTINLNVIGKDTFWPFAIAQRYGHVYIFHRSQHAHHSVAINSAEDHSGMKILNCKHVPRCPQEIYETMPALLGDSQLCFQRVRFKVYA